MTIKRFDDLPEVRVQGEALSEPILWLGLQWAVTSYGVEARDGTYAIEASRLWEDNKTKWPWEKHLAEKNWVDRHDAAAALKWAREHFKHLKPKGA